MVHEPPSEALARRLLVGLFVLVSIALTLGLGDAPIERAEIYFLDAARAMVETGDWLIPHYRGEPFYDKPPLTYWLIAVAFTILGPNLVAGRLVVVLVALATLTVVAYLGKRFAPSRDAAEETAFHAVAILATSYVFVSFARLTMSDMLLTLLTVVAGGLYLRAEVESRQDLLPWCGLVLGLGFLAKGPIAWIFFGAVLLAFAIVARRAPRIFTGAGVLGSLLAIGVASSWFMFVWLRAGVEPLKWFFLRENLQRFASATYDVSEPWWYYFAIYAVEALPWSVLAIPATALAWRARDTHVPRVLLMWSLLMVVPLSLSRGKIDYYILPILPPLSLMTARYLSGRPSRLVLRFLALATVALAAGALLFPMLPAPFAPPETTVRGIRVFFAATILAGLLCALRPSPRRVVAVSAAAVLGTAIALFGSIVPAYRAAQPNDALVDHIARERIYAPDLQVVVCDDSLRLQRDILFHLRVPVLEECQLWAVVSAERKSLLIVTLAQERSLRTAEHVRHIATLPHIPADVTRIGTLLEGAHAAKVGLLANFQTTDPVARWKRNREFKRWLDTPEGQRAEAERLEREAREAEARRREERRAARTVR
jgi:4-amino-4-deoxy-L-arabinose transferase-like glycosyltransferase